MSSSSSSSSGYTDEILSKICGYLIKYNRQQRVSFCVEKELPVSAIDVIVEKVGKLYFPLTEEVIKELINNSTKAKFGKGDETILDETVRDTNEIKADKLVVQINNDLFSQMLNEIRVEFGLPETTSLESHLYNMLIYSTGQFFNNHRDGEKADGMIATLVIILPVIHVGGDLIVKHNKEKHIVFSDDIDANIKCAAFYADCCHKVKNVKEGHRIALTYNLIAKTQETHYVHHTNMELEKLLKRYFYEDLPDFSLPKFLYFLDHSYTEHSLRWNMLKGTDIKNGSAMFNAAQRLNLVPHLILVEISRTSSREDVNERELYKYGPPRSAYEEMKATFWIGPNNENILYDKFKLSSEFTCCTIKTNCFEPYFKEVEYGNEGYDVDFRYRRAAIFLWPLKCDIPMKFIINYEKEKAEFLEMLKVPAKQEMAIKIIMEGKKHLHTSDSLKQKDDFVIYVDFVVKVGDRYVALELLSHYLWTILDLDITACIANLKSKFTISLITDLLNKWESNREYQYVLKNICDIVSNFITFDISVESVRFILEKEYNYIFEKCGISSKSEVMKKIKELLKACELARCYCPVTIQVPIVDRLTSPGFCSIDEIVSLILDLHKCNTDLVNIPWFTELKNYAISKVTEKKQLAYKPANDWSIELWISCTCNKCFLLKKFLLSKHRVKKIIMCTDNNTYQHLKRKLSHSNAPVDIVLEVTQPLFKVTLLKTEELHRKFKDEFNKFSLYLSNLQLRM